MNISQYVKCFPKVIRSSSRLIYSSATLTSASDDSKVKKATTPVGRLDDQWEAKREHMEPQKTPSEADAQSKEDPYAPFPGNKNPETGEIGGPKGPEPTRYGDWERKGRVIDF